MADPLSVASASVGFVSLAFQLFSGCIKGFILLSSAHNIGKDASTIVCMLDIQEVQLTEWARRSGLLTTDGKLNRQINSGAVESILQQLQSLLLDTEQLRKRYGLSLIESDPQKEATRSNTGDSSLSERERVFGSLSDEHRQRILKRAGTAQGKNVLKRLRWAAIDKEKMRNFATDVHFLIRELWYLLDPWRQDQMLEANQKLIGDMVVLNNKIDHLTVLSNALHELQGEHKQGEAHPDEAAEAADLKSLRLWLDEPTSVNTASDSGVVSPPRLDLLKRLERLSISELSEFQARSKNSSAGVAMYGKRLVFVEWKTINRGQRSKLIQRAENLALLLNLPKDQTFSSLQCIGLVEEQNRVGFVSHHPGLEVSRKPKSLLDLYSAKDGIEPPSLTVRVRLALRIVQIIRAFHRTGWLHKSIRSDNIFFFPSDSSDPSSIDLSHPILAGFNFSRASSPTEISEQPAQDPRDDIYRHPDAMGEPSVSFNEKMDIYSLGTVLLEIAEWRALRYLVESIVDVKTEDDVSLESLAAVRPFLLAGKGKGGTSKLKTKVGDVYQEVTIMCLNGEQAGVEEEKQADQDDGLLPDTLLDIAMKRLSLCRI